MPNPQGPAGARAAASANRDGSTARLIQLCAGYFLFYVITGVSVKYFQGPADQGLPAMTGMEYLVYNTAGGTLLCLVWVFVRGWYRIESNELVALIGLRIPRELLYIVPSGVCTAIVIPTTTLMYSLPISVMVAMVIMRGSVIVIGRLVDAVQIRQGILKKKVYLEEDLGVICAILAVSVHLVLGSSDASFDFVHSPAAVAILGSYLASYAIRIYIMNYYKNTRKAGVKLDNRGFMGIEQIAASVVLTLGCVVAFFAPRWFGVQSPLVTEFRSSLVAPKPIWPLAVLSGTAFGIVAFFSVFIFMFKGRTATFAGLVNRLTSLIAGTTATLVFWAACGGKAPGLQDWVSLGLIFVAVYFLTRSEKRRAAELAAAG
ncbi:MAG: hypothetical protein HY898_08770 [Deltaproteobacteria bacterium]|nr:hypothetical protein [Deltaproteobacteria bacterium]